MPGAGELELRSREKDGMSTKLHAVVAAWRRVSATSSRKEKIAILAACLKASGPDVGFVAACLTGDPPQGRIGVGPAAVRAAAASPPSPTSTLETGDLEAALDALVDVGGPGSASARKRRLGSLFGLATADEQEFLARLLLGDLRQGALEGLMVEAVSEASDAPAASVRRALMLSGRMDEVAHSAMHEGPAALDAIQLRLFRPLQPMLAQTAESPAEALAQLGRAAFEFKLDGARIQIHRSGETIRMYTRNLNDVTDSLPDIAESVGAWPGGDFILDAEAIAFRDDGRPLPFQTTMRRFGRRNDTASLRSVLPLSCIVFDCLRLDGATCIDWPYSKRIERMAGVVPPASTVPRIVTDDVNVANAFLERARAIGHEGVMAKDPLATWDAGARGRAWLKIKPVHTLDLVVLAAEWGHGRRHGWLSNLHLGARDGDGFVMLGKTFKGLTDEILEWQTGALLERQTRREGHIVHVRPELVVEIAFNDLQASPRYPGGLALRFARVRAYRHDKLPAQADTLETVRAIYERQVAGNETDV
jgi:ATP-dependent DNA ligase I